MLQIIVPAIRQTELWDESKEEFVTVPPMNEQTLQLEHSLISLSNGNQNGVSHSIPIKKKQQKKH